MPKNVCGEMKRRKYHDKHKLAKELIHWKVTIGTPSIETNTQASRI